MLCNVFDNITIALAVQVELPAGRTRARIWLGDVRVSFQTAVSLPVASRPIAGASCSAAPGSSLIFVLVDHVALPSGRDENQTSALPLRLSRHTAKAVPAGSMAISGSPFAALVSLVTLKLAVKPRLAE